MVSINNNPKFTNYFHIRYYAESKLLIIWVFEVIIELTKYWRKPDSEMQYSKWQVTTSNEENNVSTYSEFEIHMLIKEIESSLK